SLFREPRSAAALKEWQDARLPDANVTNAIAVGGRLPEQIVDDGLVDVRQSLAQEGPRIADERPLLFTRGAEHRLRHAESPLQRRCCDKVVPASKSVRRAGAKLPEAAIPIRFALLRQGCVGRSYLLVLARS